MSVMKAIIKRNILKSVPAILFVCCLVACSKHSDDTVPPVTPPVTNPDSMVVSLNPWFPGQVNDSSHYELIISSTEGSILIDTLLLKAKSTYISYKTTDKLVDLTTVQYSKFRQKYYVTTYKGVNPSQWDTLILGRGYEIVGSSSQVQASLHYDNIPANYGNEAQFSSIFGTTGYDFLTGPTTLDVHYEQQPGMPVYLLFPTLALYKFYYPVTLADTVNVAVMDTATRRNFTMSSTYALNYLSLSGLLDTTDYGKALLLYQWDDLRPNGAQVEYPNKYIQKYQLRFGARNSDKDRINHFSYGDTVAYNFNFPDKTNYNLLATQKDNFSIQFLNIKPTYYESDWENDKAYYVIFASKDSTTINPQNIMDHLKSRSHYLGGDFSDLTIKQFLFETVPNVDYASYVRYMFNSSVRSGRIIYWSDQLTKVF
jgi:hypothetical protein